MNNRPDLIKISLYCYIMVALFFLMCSHLTLADATGENDFENDNERRSALITLTSPKNARVVNTIGIDLEWNATGMDLKVMEFDVYVSEDGTKVAGNNPAVRFGTNLKTTSMKAMILLDLTTYYWKVVGRDIENNTEMSSIVSQFSIDRSIMDPDSYLGISVSNPTPDYGEEVYLRSNRTYTCYYVTSIR